MNRYLHKYKCEMCSGMGLGNKPCYLTIVDYGDDKPSPGNCPEIGGADWEWVSTDEADEDE